MIMNKFITKDELLKLPNCDLSKVLKKVSNDTLLRISYISSRYFTDIVRIYDTDTNEDLLKEAVLTTAKF